MPISPPWPSSATCPLIIHTLLARLQVVPATIVYLFAAYHLYHYPDINTHFRNAIG